MHIYLARHGQTNYNELGLCNADPAVDVHLTETGIQQAQILADHLKGTGFEKIYVSELKRTQQTAAYINHYHSLPLSVDARLNDNRTGFEGQPAEDYYDALEAATDKWSFSQGDGETLNDVKARVEAFINELKSQSYNSVLIVTSMSIVQAFYGIVNSLSNEEAWGFAVDKGSCIELDI